MPWYFAAELSRHGPDSPGPPAGLLAARGYCARVARAYSENFTVASVLLPRKLLPHFHAVYAYCRWADDLADETDGGDTAVSLLHWWRGEVLKMYATVGDPPPAGTVGSGDLPRKGGGGGDWVASDVTVARGPTTPTSPLAGEVAEPSGATPAGGGGEGITHCIHPVFVALAETVRRFNIPPEPFLDLLTAFQQDQRVKRYATFADVLNYCKNSANPVGQLVLHLFRCADDSRLSLSDEVCTGLQLANFWQDVARDFAIGRVYLPADDMARFGVREADIAEKRFTPAFKEMMRFQVERTRGYFGRGKGLLPLLPREVRVDVELFISGGEATLNAIERQGYDVLTRRPVVSKWEKMILLGKAVAGRLF